MDDEHLDKSIKDYSLRDLIATVWWLFLMYAGVGLAIIAVAYVVGMLFGLWTMALPTAAP